MKPLVIIAGPTAVGKSELAVLLSKRINGEVVSADSMQVYKGMDIGSAKITPAEMDGVKHHLIDVLEPTEDFNVALFQKLSSDACEDIIKRGKIPVLCGGTGFYIQALLYGIDFNESTGELSDYRKSLEKEAAENGPDGLYEELLRVDPESSEIIHKNNVKRVIRALEFYHETGRPISSHNTEQHSNPPVYDSCFFVLNDDREKIYDKINARVDKMLSMGLVDEVKALKEQGLTRNNISMQGLGYKEILDYLDGKCTLDDAVEIIKRDSRHFAKRQITWFKREKNVIWLNRYDFDNDSEKLLEFMLNVLKLKGII